METSTPGARGPRVCIGASAGGHLTQLLRLESAWRDYEAFCVTTLPLVADSLARFGTVYVIGECNRHHPLRIIGVLLRAARVVLKERPDVVLTTGSLPLAMVCFIAKLRGAKIVWVDSITNVERLSMSGRFVRRFADLCLTQWPGVQRKYRGLECVGAVV